MSAGGLLARCLAAGLTLRATPDGVIAVSPRSALSGELAAAIRAERDGLLALLRANDPAAPPPGPAEYFDFAPPGDPANDDEALQERVAIMVEGNGWDEATALREARWQADKERCWRVYLRNAARVLAAPVGERVALLERYRAEAQRRYGADTARSMAEGLALWVSARTRESRP